MKKYQLLSILAFTFLLIAGPLYAAKDTTRLDAASVGTGYRIRIIPTYDMAEFDEMIILLYQQLNNSPDLSLSDRIIFFSQVFLNQPYLLGALGEGVEATFDQNPLYRTDAFDCVSYVSTVLALAESNSLEEFQKTINDIRYADGEPAYVNRNHFMSADWNVNNKRKGYVTNITEKIHDENGTPVAKAVTALIDKPRWFQVMRPSKIKRLAPLSLRQQKKMIRSLHAQGSQTESRLIRFSYIPLGRLFDEKGNPNNFLFDQIPSGSIIEVVTPGWDRRKDLGTRLNVSHLGFAISVEESLLFREASSVDGKIIDVPLKAYLRNYIGDTVIKGIAVLQAQPRGNEL